MEVLALKFKGSGCFVSEWAGFDCIKPINVIIGRNNTGKSQLLELVRISCDGVKANSASAWQFHCTGVLVETALRPMFPENVSGGHLGGNHWAAHGQWFVDVPVEWEINKSGGRHAVQVKDDYQHPSGNTTIAMSDGRQKTLQRVVEQYKTPLQGRKFFHLLADRDIRPEIADRALRLSPDGTGATNIIRRLITSASHDMPRELIQQELRAALNEIFGSDGHFTEIQVQEHDGEGPSGGATLWEVFLGEERKGLVALSKSGSGLKTVMLVLLHLLVLPKISGEDPANYVFAFEELENNLHPALLRRLLKFIASYAQLRKTTIFLTTHSSTALDLFGSSEDAQIVHVTHDGSSAKATTIDAHFSRLGVVSELGAKPSDLLQANGIIWVEGPSDAIYINKWIQLASNGSLREGRDYLCAFYGGSLLARVQFTSPEEAEDELVNLLMVNPNVVVVCDSDKTSLSSPLKPRVKRIKAEMASVPRSVVWVTSPKEMENYLPGSVITKALESSTALRSPDRFEAFFPREGKKDSYCEIVLERNGLDKIEFATLCVSHTENGDMDTQFDWSEQIAKVVAAIERWNE